VHSKSNAGNKLYEVHEDLLGSTDLSFTDILNQNIDVLFLCLGHGESSKFLSEHKIDDNINIIDLANDFRLDNNAKHENRKFIYGLPELNYELIASAKNIANPGCFATAIQLGLLPLAAKGLINDVYTTGITGSTGAGQSLSSTSHFSWRANNIQPYKTLTHQHLGEIHQSLHQLNSKDAAVHFVPWRGDFTRGIFASSTIDCNISLDEANSIFDAFYKHHPFTIVSKKQISLKQVVNTNKAVLFLEKNGDKLVIHSVIDNLLKGASGQAVQNMNIMFGLDQTSGLKLKSVAF
jgi:N-acetyl-gamma-glutamyl-phosphate reductase